jgi:hypothetical protein
MSLNSSLFFYFSRIMKIFAILFLIVAIIDIQLCLFENKRFDKKAALEIVSLSPSDLRSYAELQSKLKRDYKMIKKFNSTTNRNSFNTDTFANTNSYYLNKIDSVGYQTILVKLKGKYYDEFWISKSGHVVFQLKRVAQMTDNYDTVYSHQLISSGCNLNCLPIYYTPVRVYKDSIINDNWKYSLSSGLSGW